jgi:hypothetical protein
METICLDLTEYATNRYFASLNEEQIDNILVSENVFKLDGTRPTPKEVIAIAKGDAEDIEVIHCERKVHELLWGDVFYNYLKDSAYDDGADSEVTDSDEKISVE